MTLRLFIHAFRNQIIHYLKINSSIRLSFVIIFSGPRAGQGDGRRGRRWILENFPEHSLENKNYNYVGSNVSDPDKIRFSKARGGNMRKYVSGFVHASLFYFNICN